MHTSLCLSHSFLSACGVHVSTLPYACGVHVSTLPYACGVHVSTLLYLMHSLYNDSAFFFILRFLRIKTIALSRQYECIIYTHHIMFPKLKKAL